MPPKILAHLGLLAILFSSPAPAAAAQSVPLVEVAAVIPGVAVEMRYATTNNFTGRVIYPCGRCFLDRRTARKLAAAQAHLQEHDLSLKVWDCYRPLSVQRILWDIVPDSRYVADPKNGSRHNRGTAVDVTLVDAAGNELEMPTGFDDFSPRAASAAEDISPVALKNRERLAEAMRKAGFRQLPTEWWHYDDPDVSGAILEIPFSELCR